MIWKVKREKRIQREMFAPRGGGAKGLVERCEIWRSVEDGFCRGSRRVELNIADGDLRKDCSTSNASTAKELFGIEE